MTKGPAAAAVLLAKQSRRRAKATRKTCYLASARCLGCKISIIGRCGSQKRGWSGESQRCCLAAGHFCFLELTFQWERSRGEAQKSEVSSRWWWCCCWLTELMRPPNTQLYPQRCDGGPRGGQQRGLHKSGPRTLHLQRDFRIAHAARPKTRQREKVRDKQRLRLEKQRDTIGRGHVDILWNCRTVYPTDGVGHGCGLLFFEVLIWVSDLFISSLIMSIMPLLKN